MKGQREQYASIQFSEIIAGCLLQKEKVGCLDIICLINCIEKKFPEVEIVEDENCNFMKELSKYVDIQSDIFKFKDNYNYDSILVYKLRKTTLRAWLKQQCSFQVISCISNLENDKMSEVKLLNYIRDYLNNLKNSNFNKKKKIKSDFFPKKAV